MELLDEAACGSAVKKCKVSEFGEEDRISRMPDHTLAYILSFLPTDSAVKTMLLKPFGKLWTTMSNLDFNVCLFADLPTTPPMHRWFSFVDHVLLHHEAPIVTNFRLKFGCSIYSSGLMQAQVVEKIDSWISFAVRKKVEVLEVDIGRYCYEPIFEYDLPSFVLRCDTLTELHLARCNLTTEAGMQMKSLKTLSLRVLYLNDTSMEIMLSACPALETLILIDCQGLFLLKLPHVKALKISMDESEVSSWLQIIAPNLNSMSVSGKNVGYVELRGPSSLSTATVDYSHRGKSFFDRRRNIWTLLSCIKHAEYLRVCHWCVLELALKTSNDWLSLSRKSAVVKTGPMKCHLLGIMNLLQNSPKLEELTVFIEPDITLWNLDDITQIRYLENMTSQLMQTVVSSEMCRHLKIVNLRGYVVNSFAIELVKLILRSSNCLEQIVISTEGCGPAANQLRGYHIQKSLYEELSQLARGSKKVVVRL